MYQSACLSTQTCAVALRVAPFTLLHLQIINSVTVLLVRYQVMALLVSMFLSCIGYMLLPQALNTEALAREGLPNAGQLRVKQTPELLNSCRQIQGYSLIHNLASHPTLLTSGVPRTSGVSTATYCASHSPFEQVPEAAVSRPARNTHYGFRIRQSLVR